MESAEKIRIQIGQRIRQAREARHWSQSQLALAFHASPAQVSKMEAGKLEWSHAYVIPLASALGISPEWLLTGAGDSAPTVDPRLDSFDRLVARAAQSTLPETMRPTWEHLQGLDRGMREMVLSLVHQGVRAASWHGVPNWYSLLAAARVAPQLADPDTLGVAAPTAPDPAELRRARMRLLCRKEGPPSPEVLAELAGVEGPLALTIPWDGLTADQRFQVLSAVLESYAVAQGKS